MPLVVRERQRAIARRRGREILAGHRRRERRLGILLRNAVEAGVEIGDLALEFDGAGPLGGREGVLDQCVLVDRRPQAGFEFGGVDEVAGRRLVDVGRDITLVGFGAARVSSEDLSDARGVGLGAAGSEPSVTRLCLASTHEGDVDLAGEQGRQRLVDDRLLRNPDVDEDGRGRRRTDALADDATGIRVGPGTASDRDPSDLRQESRRRVVTGGERSPAHELDRLGIVEAGTDADEDRRPRVERVLAQGLARQEARLAGRRSTSDPSAPNNDSRHSATSSSVGWSSGWKSSRW